MRFKRVIKCLPRPRVIMIADINVTIQHRWSYFVKSTWHTSCILVSTVVPCLKSLYSTLRCLSHHSSSLWHVKAPKVSRIGCFRDCLSLAADPCSTARTHPLYSQFPFIVIPLKPADFLESIYGVYRRFLEAASIAFDLFQHSSPAEETISPLWAHDVNTPPDKSCRGASKEVGQSTSCQTFRAD